MPGIPLRNRCQYCRKRKIKCDETWPTCGNCQRAKKQCSGPSTDLKFVQNNCHENARKIKLSQRNMTTTDSSTGGSAQGGKLVHVQQKSARNGTGSFHKMKMLRQETPREVPDTEVDQLVKRFIFCLGIDDGYDLCMFMSCQVLDLLPQQLHRSQALGNAVDCLLSTWTNSQRGLPPSEVLDLRAYGKALRSLQDALQHPEESSGVGTLAATSILQRIQQFYDVVDGPKTMHMNGVYSLMAHRGPPKMKDELDMQLALDNYGVMLGFSLATGLECLYARDDWTSAIKAALDAGIVQLGSLWNETFRLCVELADWPALNNKLRQLYADPLAEGAQQLALGIIKRSVELAKALMASEKKEITACFERGDIIEIADPDAPFLSRLEFTSMSLAHVVVYWTMSGILTNRIMAHAMAFLGMKDETLDAQNAALSRRIWRTYPYAMRHRKMAGRTIVWPFMMSLEAADAFERPLVVDMINDLEDSRNSMAELWTEETIMARVIMMTGRSPLSSDADVGSGLRSEGRARI